MVMRSLKEIVSESLENINPGADFDVFFSEYEEHGHLSSNIAFKEAKRQAKEPKELAQEIKNVLDKEGKFGRIEVAGAGFLNFWVSDNILGESLKDILKAGSEYGKNTVPAEERKRIQVEYVSANPTGPLTLANGRGGFLGDVLSNVLEWTGHEVEREYYVNDTGNQVLTLGKSILASAGFLPKEDYFYKGEYVSEWAEKNKELIREYKEKPLELGKKAAEEFMGLIKEALETKAGIRFDRYTSEDNDIHKKGFIEKALDIFKEKGMTYEKDGALWLKTTEFGDDKDRVLVTSDNIPTYLLADSGHTLETKERGFDGKINILGPDHYGYVKRIKASAEILGFSEYDVIVTQMVRIVEDGKEMKMSKRRGQFLEYAGVVDEVGADVTRFFFLQAAPETHMDFDLGLAKERSQKNPVYYVQYAYVRAKNILKKLKEENKEPELNPDISFLSTKEDKTMIIKLVQFPELINEISKDRQVHQLNRYALSLAKTFHNFYEKERVIGEKEEVVSSRAALVKAALIIFENLFKVINISAPEEM